MLKSFSIRMCYVIYTSPVCLSTPSLLTKDYGWRPLSKRAVKPPKVIKGTRVIVHA